MISEFNSGIKLEYVDAFDLKKHYDRFDMCYSSGVLEHFDREQAVEFLREQAKCARYVLAAVPTKHIVTGIVEDIPTNYYNLRELSSIFRDAGLKVVMRLGYGNPQKSGIFQSVSPLLFYRFIQDMFSYCTTIVWVGTLDK